MSYFSCVQDAAEDIEVMIYRFIGEDHPSEQAEEGRVVDDDVALMMTKVFREYDAKLDHNMLWLITEFLCPTLEDQNDDDKALNIGKLMKENRSRYHSMLMQTSVTSEQVFRWFMVHAESLKIEIATPDVLERAYREYWVTQFDRLSKEMTTFAVKLDNDDDFSYSQEARNDAEEHW